MADKHDAAPAAKGGITPDQFTTGLAEYVAARTRRESAAGFERSILARLEKQALHKPGWKLFLKFRDMEPEEAELTLLTALRYSRWATLPIGAQSSLFTATDDLGLPGDKAKVQLEEAEIRSMAFEAGLAGRNVTDHAFMPGTPNHQVWCGAWQEGQAELARRLFVAPPTDGTTLKPEGKKARQATTKKVDAKPGGRRGRKPGGSHAAA